MLNVSFETKLKENKIKFVVFYQLRSYDYIYILYKYMENNIIREMDDNEFNVDQSFPCSHTNEK